MPSTCLSEESNAPAAPKGFERSNALVPLVSPCGLTSAFDPLRTLGNHACWPHGQPITWKAVPRGLPALLGALKQYRRGEYEAALQSFEECLLWMPRAPADYTAFHATFLVLNHRSPDAARVYRQVLNSTSEDQSPRTRYAAADITWRSVSAWTRLLRLIAGKRPETCNRARASPQNISYYRTHQCCPKSVRFPPIADIRSLGLMFHRG